MHTKIKQPEPVQRYHVGQNYFGDSEAVFRSWFREGRLLDLQSGKVLPANHGLNTVYYMRKMFRLSNEFSFKLNDITEFYRKLNANEIQIEWLFGPHAYTIYKMKVLQRLEEKHEP